MRAYIRNHDLSSGGETTIDDKKIDITRTAIGAIILKPSNHNELLLIQRAEDDTWGLEWEFVRGKCDKEKSLKKLNFTYPQMVIAGLHREVKEEVGLIIEPIKLIDKFSYIFPDNKTVMYIFLCKMKDKNQRVILSEEHINYAWITKLNEAKELGVSKELMVSLNLITDKNGYFNFNVRSYYEFDAEEW